LGLISVKIPIIGNIVFLDDIFFYEQIVFNEVIVMLGDVVVGTTDVQILTVE
jgi:hypothetical protein